MEFTDFLIMMLVDVIIPSDLWYFALSVLGLSSDDLEVCMEGEDRTSVVFRLLTKSVKKNNMKMKELKKKFFDFNLYDTREIFNKYKG